MGKIINLNEWRIAKFIDRFLKRSRPFDSIYYLRGADRIRRDIQPFHKERLLKRRKSKEKGKLAKQMKQSDREIENALREIEPHLRRIARYYLSNDEDQKDAVQECLLKIWTYWNSFQVLENQKSWAFRVLKNACIDIARKRNVAQANTQRLMDYEVEASFPDSFEYEPLYNALAQLRAPDQEVIIMRYFLGYTMREIALMKETPLGTICARSGRSIRKLNQLLKQQNSLMIS